VGGREHLERIAGVFGERHCQHECARRPGAVNGHHGAVDEDVDAGAGFRDAAHGRRERARGGGERIEPRARRRAEAQQAAGPAVGNVEIAVGADGDTARIRQARGEDGDAAAGMHLGDGAVCRVVIRRHLPRRDVDGGQSVGGEADGLLEDGDTP
jgi:hypothetical protein